MNNKSSQTNATLSGYENIHQIIKSVIKPRIRPLLSLTFLNTNTIAQVTKPQNNNATGTPNKTEKRSISLKGFAVTSANITNGEFG